MTEKVKCAVNAINAHDEFCTFYAFTSAVIQLHSHASDLLTSACKRANDSCC